MPFLLVAPDGTSRIIDPMKYDDELDIVQLARYASSMNSRARRLRILGTLTAVSLRDRIFESGGKCEWCHTNLLRQEFELDHIENLANGGSNTASNIVVSCPDCNRRKSARNVVSFALETLARTGIETPIIKRVLERHNVRGSVQRSLFGDDPAETAGRPLFTTSDTDDDAPPPDDVPPYRW
ncbi:MAG: HNH endonuclease [Anaerolineae bacterium]|nr:HNH endonuclease [Anaerolineae bacterium]